LPLVQLSMRCAYFATAPRIWCAGFFDRASGLSLRHQRLDLARAGTHLRPCSRRGKRATATCFGERLQPRTHARAPRFEQRAIIILVKGIAGWRLLRLCRLSAEGEMQHRLGTRSRPLQQSPPSI
jgi:hypothetical protein